MFVTNKQTFEIVSNGLLLQSAVFRCASIMNMQISIVLFF